MTSDLAARPVRLLKSSSSCLAIVDADVAAGTMQETRPQVPDYPTYTGSFKHERGVLTIVCETEDSAYELVVEPSTAFDSHVGWWKGSESGPYGDSEFLVGLLEPRLQVDEDGALRPQVHESRWALLRCDQPLAILSFAKADPPVTESNYAHGNLAVLTPPWEPVERRLRYLSQVGTEGMYLSFSIDDGSDEHVGLYSDVERGCFVAPDQRAWLYPLLEGMADGQSA